jgi:hypothetical protein
VPLFFDATRQFQPVFYELHETLKIRRHSNLVSQVDSQALDTIFVKENSAITKPFFDFNKL